MTIDVDAFATELVQGRRRLEAALHTEQARVTPTGVDSRVAADARLAALGEEVRELQRATDALDAEDKQALPARIAAVRRYVLAPRFPEPGSYPNRQAAETGAADASDALAMALGVGPAELIPALLAMAAAYDDPDQLTRLAEEADEKGRLALAEASALEAELARRDEARP